MATLHTVGVSLSKPARASVQVLRQGPGERAGGCREYGKHQ